MVALMDTGTPISLAKSRHAKGEAAGEARLRGHYA